MFINKTTTAVRMALIASATATAWMSPAAIAADEDTKEVERIQVTGSAIKRTDLEGALPITLITSEDIARSGVESVGELIQQIPSMQGFTTAADSVGGEGGGIATASLHNLGASYTLVLLNGRRIARSGSGSTIDLNSIPLRAIERVEILTDGASALYGSDAIAGVVNFILKNNMQETIINGRYTQPQKKGGKGWNGSITSGFGDLDDDGFNVLLSYSHDSKEQLKATDRDFSKTGIISFKDNGRDLYFFNGSPNAIPGNARFYFNDKDNSTLDFNPYKNKNGKCAENTSYVDGWCWFDYTSTLEIHPESERDSFLAKIDFNISDDIKGFVETSYSDFSLTSRIAPYPSGGVLIPKDSALFNKYFLPNLPKGKTVDDVKFGLGVWRALPAGNRTTEYNTKSTHVVAGIKGLIADDIDFETAITHSVNDGDQNFTDGWLLEKPFIKAIETGAIDIFAPAGTVTKKDVDAAGIVYRGNWTNSKTVMNGFDFKMSTPIFELSGGEAYIATGFDYRTYNFSQTLSQVNKDASILFMGVGTPYDLERDVYGAFAELLAPVADSLELSASLRYDNIGAIDDVLNKKTVNDSENDITYKLSAKWQATDDLLVRASYGTGFKAPSMLEISRPRSEAGVTGGSYVCPFKSDDPYAKWCKPGKQQYNIFAEGDSKLQPEKSKQLAIGFVYAPSTDFSFGVDYWNVEMEDLVTAFTEAQIFSDPVKYRDLFTFKTNTATNIDELAIIQSSVNVGNSKNSGLDWHFNQSNELSFGTLRFSWTGTYLLQSEYTKPGTTDEYISSMGRFGDDNAVAFRVISQLNATFEHDDFSHSLTTNYRSGYMDQYQSVDDCAVTIKDANGDCVAVQLAISSYTKTDYQTKYQIMDEMSITIGINNLFDVKPDLSLRSGGAGHQVGYDPRYTDSYGRTFYLAGEYKF